MKKGKGNHHQHHRGVASRRVHPSPLPSEVVTDPTPSPLSLLEVCGEHSLTTIVPLWFWVRPSPSAPSQFQTHTGSVHPAQCTWQRSLGNETSRRLCGLTGNETSEGEHSLTSCGEDAAEQWRSLEHWWRLTTSRVGSSRWWHGVSAQHSLSGGDAKSKNRLGSPEPHDCEPVTEEEQ